MGFAKVKVLTMFTSAPSNIITKRPVRSLKDLKGMELRAPGTTLQILDAWGAKHVGMPMSETPQALQQGVVEGLVSTLETLMDFKFAELCRYVTVTNTIVFPFAVVMNMDKWNALPKDVQKVFDELGPQQSAWTGVYMDNHVQESIDWAKKTHDVTFIQLPKEEKAKWDKLLEPITDNWIKANEAKGLPAKAIVQDIKDFARMYEGK